MKTIKAILKEFMNGKTTTDDDQKTVQIRNQGATETKNLNNEHNETETDEIHGDSGMDSADDPQNFRDPSGNQPSEGQETPERTETGGGDSGRGEGGGSTGGGIRLTIEEYESALKESYEKGWKEGRNTGIEEKYFPKNNDGIPRFPGNAQPQNPADSIFSIAREA